MSDKDFSTLPRKAITGVKLDGNGEGTFTANIATLDVVDHDGDVSIAGAFKAGQAVRIAQWGHNWGALPAGRGVIGGDAKRATVDGEFFLDTSHGKDTYITVKRLGDLQQWSHGYDVIEASTAPEDLAPYPGATRVLKSLDIVEVSPVMLGAGIGTQTESIKGGAATLAARIERMLADTPTAIEHARAAVTMREKSGRVLSASNRTRLEALVSAWDTGLADLRTLLRDTDPNAVDDESKAQLALAAMQIERLRAESRDLGVGV